MHRPMRGFRRLYPIRCEARLKIAHIYPIFHRGFKFRTRRQIFRWLCVYRRGGATGYDAA